MIQSSRHEITSGKTLNLPLKALLIGLPQTVASRLEHACGLEMCVLDDPSGLDVMARIFKDESCCVILLRLDPDSYGEHDYWLSKIRQRMPGAPLIAVLMEHNESLAFDALCAGADDCLTTEEINEQRLRGAIRVALAHRIQLAEAAHDWRMDADEQSRKSTRELEESNAALERANQELQLLDKMKNAFISITSHELRTPLSVITGMMKVIERSMRDADENLQHALNVAITGADRLQNIVEKSVRAAQSGEYDQRIKRKLMPADACLLEVEEKLEPFLQLRHLNMVIDVEKKLPEVWMDPHMILETLEHLLMNAIKFTPDEGYIVVTVRLSKDRRKIVYRISDTGIGITDEDRPFVFDDFFSSLDVMHHSSGVYEFEKRGLGLGLSYVKRCVEAHGGTVGMETIHGTGSMFYFTIPVEK